MRINATVSKEVIFSIGNFFSIKLKLVRSRIAARIYVFAPNTWYGRSRKSYQDRAIFNAEGVTRKGWCYVEPPRIFLFERCPSATVICTSTSSHLRRREMDLDGLKCFLFLVRNTGALIARRAWREKWKKRSFQASPIQGISLITAHTERLSPLLLTRGFWHTVGGATMSISSVPSSFLSTHTFRGRESDEKFYERDSAVVNAERLVSDVSSSASATVYIASASFFSPQHPLFLLPDPAYFIALLRPVFGLLTDITVQFYLAVHFR